MAGDLSAARSALSPGLKTWDRKNRFLRGLVVYIGSIASVKTLPMWPSDWSHQLLGEWSHHRTFHSWQKMALRCPHQERKLSPIHETGKGSYSSLCKHGEALICVMSMSEIKILMWKAITFGSTLWSVLKSGVLFNTRTRKACINTPCPGSPQSHLWPRSSSFYQRPQQWILGHTASWNVSADAEIPPLILHGSIWKAQHVRLWTWDQVHRPASVTSQLWSRDSYLPSETQVLSSWSRVTEQRSYTKWSLQISKSPAEIL